MAKYSGMRDEAVIAALIDGDQFNAMGARKVYAVKGDRGVVIKEQGAYGPIANFTEWLIWNAISKTDLADVFAECHTISMSGRYLIMERLEPLTKEDLVDAPRLPSWTNDRKFDAFGRSAHNLVKMLDYGQLSLEEALARAPREPWALAVSACDPLARRARENELSEAASRKAMDVHGWASGCWPSALDVPPTL